MSTEELAWRIAAIESYTDVSRCADLVAKHTHVTSEARTVLIRAINITLGLLLARTREDARLRGWAP